MGWFDFLKPNRVSELNGSIFYPISDSTNIFDLQLVRAFQEIPEVNAVLNRDADMFSNMRLSVVDEDGNELENDLSELLKNPNWFQAQKEFLRQTRLFHLVYGNEYMYTLRGSSISPVRALFTLPPNLVDVTYNQTTPFFLEQEKPEIKYTFQVASGKAFPLTTEDIIHLNENRVKIGSLQEVDFLKGVTKLVSLSAPINNIRAAYESRGVILRTRGALGILTNSGADGMGASTSIDPKEKDRLQDAFSNYGTLAGQHQQIITSLNLQWQQMGQNEPVKLGLYQETRESFSKIIDAFGHRKEMYVTEKGSTFNNQDIAEKNTYTGAIIPAANEWVFALNQSITKNLPYKIIGTFDHLPIFQDDLKEHSQVVSTMTSALSTALADGGITIEQYQEEIARLYKWD